MAKQMQDVPVQSRRQAARCVNDESKMTIMMLSELFLDIFSFAGSSLLNFWLTNPFAVGLTREALLIIAVMAIFHFVADRRHRNRLNRLSSLIKRESESNNTQMDLWFRLIYQAPFLDKIREDEEERSLYQDSILRKLYGVADRNRRHPDSASCSRYIGALAFLANPKRANIPWPIFRDAVVANFCTEILQGKISRHVINDHYKGKYRDLVETAQRKDAEILPAPKSKKKHKLLISISKTSRD
jgi:hypothetical protein